MARRSISVRVADFETTTLLDDCRVWGWGSISVDNLDDFITGNSIQSFIEYLFSFPSITYFHNLAFDGSFIFDYLLNNGFKWVKNNPNRGEFTSLISNMGKFYSITITSPEGVKVELRDSLKKIPLSVAKIATSFKLEDKKLSIDYKAPREEGHILTDKEISYIRNDIAIVAQALKLQEQAGMKALTVGADALKEYKSILGRKEFTRLFPTLSLELDSEIRKAYRGGFTYANPLFSRRLLGPGKVYDVNSLYPYVMYSRRIPYGQPEFIEGSPLTDGRLFITSITFTAKIRDSGIPCIQVKKSPHFSPTEYLREIREPVTLSCTNVDLELWNLNYEMNIISYNGSFMFDSLEGVFSDYIDKWMQVKATSVGGMREIAKLHLNSLYGKFATNTNITGKHPILVDGIVKLVLGEHEERLPVYTPAGVFITAYARDVTIRAAMANLERFAYADTDSLHLIGLDEPESIDIDPNRLGSWKHEGDFSRAVYVRAKQYAETMLDGTESVHIAGAPKEITERLTPLDLLTDAEWTGKLVPVRTRGGVVLAETTFTFTA